MATVAQTERRTEGAGDERFFLVSACLMTLVLVAGFSIQLAMGRSTFVSPWPLHLHAFLFFGWTALYLTQNVLVSSDRLDVHRRLGRLAAFWVPAMVVMGIYITVAMVRRGAVPFFFEPLYFLIMNPVSVLTFAALAVAAVAKRSNTQTHRRLMFCAMAILTGPGFGRLLPMPLLIPYAGWAAFGAIALFPLAGIVADLRRSGRVHPAWWTGLGTIVVMQLAIVGLSGSSIGRTIYGAVTAGSPGAAVPPNAYPAPPLS